MNRKLMKTFKLGFLILGISLSFTNCAKEEIISENDNKTIINTDANANSNTSDFTIRTLELKDIEANTEVFDKIKKIKNKARKKNQSQKTVYSSDQSFVIDTDIVKYIQNQDRTYHSYTFPIYGANNNSGLENLMLSSQEDGTYRTYIVTYDLTEQEILDLNNNLPVDLNDKVSFTEFKDDRLVNNIFSREYRQSTTIFIITEGPCSHPEHQNDHLTASCTHPVSSTSSVHISNTSNGNRGTATPVGQSNQNNYNYGGGATSPISSRTVKESLLFYITEIVGLDRQEVYRLKSLNTRDLEEIKTFLIDNNAEEAKEFINWKIEFEKLPNEPCGIKHDCVKSMKIIAEGLRKFHGEEGALIADYFDGLVADFNSFTKADLQGFYDTAKAITQQYNDLMFISIVGGFVEGITPILEIALFEMGLPVAVKLLQKIPVSWVYRGVRLNSVVKKVGLLGEMGTSNTIRIVKTNSPITKARELFNSLTKHKIGNLIDDGNGVLRANMGNGNFIIYRPSSASTSNFPATISLDFRAAGIWTQVRNVKFIRP